MCGMRLEPSLTDEQRPMVSGGIHGSPGARNGGLHVSGLDEGRMMTKGIGE